MRIAWIIVGLCFATQSVAQVARPPDAPPAIYGLGFEIPDFGAMKELAPRLSCRSFKANEVRLQLHALAYNLANFLRTLVLPKAIADWSLTSLRDRVIKVGAKAFRHARSITLQLAEVAIPRDQWAQILVTISGLRARRKRRESQYRPASQSLPVCCTQQRNYAQNKCKYAHSRPNGIKSVEKRSRAARNQNRL